MKEQIEKQAIEEIAYSVCRLENKPENCASCMWKASCENYLSAENYYTAGYRKQIVGDWIINGTDGDLIGNWRCSVCKGVSLKDPNFCPNCGARMTKGENNEN